MSQFLFSLYLMCTKPLSTLPHKTHGPCGGEGIRHRESHRKDWEKWHKSPYAALLPYQRILRLSKVKNLFLTSYKSNEERSLHYNKVEERPPSIMAIACCWKPVRRCLYHYSFEIPHPSPFCFFLFILLFSPFTCWSSRTSSFFFFFSIR